MTSPSAISTGTMALNDSAGSVSSRMGGVNVRWLARVTRLYSSLISMLPL